MNNKILQELHKYNSSYTAKPRYLMLGYKEIIQLCEENGWLSIPENLILFGLKVNVVNIISMLLIAL